jgi:hypothetical protein
MIITYETLVTLPGKLKFSFNGMLATRYQNNQAFCYELCNDGRWELTDNFKVN